MFVADVDVSIQLSAAPPDTSEPPLLDSDAVDISFEAACADQSRFHFRITQVVNNDLASGSGSDFLDPCQDSFTAEFRAFADPNGALFELVTVALTIRECFDEWCGAQINMVIRLDAFVPSKAFSAEVHSVTLLADGAGVSVDKTGRWSDRSWCLAAGLQSRCGG